MRQGREVCTRANTLYPAGGLSAHVKDSGPNLSSFCPRAFAQQLVPAMRVSLSNGGSFGCWTCQSRWHSAERHGAVRTSCALGVEATMHAMWFLPPMPDATNPRHWWASCQ